MADLYLLITPLFGVLVLLNLLVLKLALKNLPFSISPEHVNHLFSKEQPINKYQKQPNWFFNTYCFLLKNSSLAELCLTRRAKNKLPLMIALSLIALCCFFISSFWMFALAGSCFGTFFFLFQVLTTKTKQGQQKIDNADQDKNQSIQLAKSILYILIGGLSMAGFCFVSIWSFKSYKNQTLAEFLINFVINVSLDFFAVQPMVYFALSLPLGYSRSVQNYIEFEEKVTYLAKHYVIEETKIENGRLFSGINNTSFNNNRSFNGKILDLNMLQHDKSTTIKKSKLESRLTQQIRKQAKENENLMVAIQISKRIKQQRTQLPPLMTPTGKRTDSDDKLIEALNNTTDQLKVETPVAQLRLSQQSMLSRTFRTQNSSYVTKRVKTQQINQRQIKPTRDRSYKNKTVDINSPKIKSPHIIRSPYQVQFQERDILESGTNKQSDNASFLKNQTEQSERRGSNTQVEEDEQTISTQAKINKRNKFQQLQIVNRDRINRFGIQNSISPIQQQVHTKDQSNKNTIDQYIQNFGRIGTGAVDRDCEDQQEEHNNSSIQKRFFRKRTISDLQNVAEKDQTAGNRISLPKHSQNSNILRNYNFDDGEEGSDNQNQVLPSLDAKKKSSLNESFEQDKDKNLLRNTLLQIREESYAEVQELDTNSPERRRRPKFEGLTPNRDVEYHSKKRRPSRKYSSGKKRMIKFTSGEPYLEYLPNMLSKQYQKNHKKSQHQLIQKEEGFSSEKKGKSVRRFKNTRDPIVPRNDQNDCPDFIVEEI